MVLCRPARHIIRNKLNLEFSSPPVSLCLSPCPFALASSIPSPTSFRSFHPVPPPLVHFLCLLFQPVLSVPSPPLSFSSSGPGRLDFTPDFSSLPPRISPSWKDVACSSRKGHGAFPLVCNGTKSSTLAYYALVPVSYCLRVLVLVLVLVRQGQHGRPSPRRAGCLHRPLRCRKLLRRLTLHL